MAKRFWLRFEFGEWFALVIGCNEDDHGYEEIADIVNRKPLLRQTVRGSDIKKLYSRVKARTKTKNEEVIAKGLASALGIALI